MMKEPSPIERACLDGFEFFIKRDDLLGDYLGGNKARKLEFFVQNSHKFEPNSRIISYGSSQSNALAALSVFARQKGFTLIFVCEKISNFLKENPCGNYAFALKNGAHIIENKDFATRKEKALSLVESKDIFIEEGVACKEAQLGFETLAKEIKMQSKELGCEFDIFLPAGTGASALYVAKYSKMRVFTCACVGGEHYLKQQMLDLEPNFSVEILSKKDALSAHLSPNSPFSTTNFGEVHLANFFQKAKVSLVKATNSLLNSANSPNLFILKTSRKFHFAKPYKELLRIYQKALKECGVEFSLLYDSVGLLTMLAYKDFFTRKVLYIHQGGARGNESMLARYAYKGF